MKLQFFKNIKFLVTQGLVLLSIISVTSCNEFLDVNKDPNSPAQVNEPLLLTGVLVNFAYEVLGGYPVRVTNTWIKQTTYNGVLPNYDNYYLTENDADNLWTYYSYTDVMHNCKLLQEQASKNKAYDYSAMARIIWAWNLSIIADLYNNAPYTQAWQPDAFPKPAYDSQENLYKTIQTLLDSAIIDINKTGKNASIIPDTDDFIYKGDMSKWEKLAYTLKARFYMRLTYAPGYSPTEQATLALDALSKGLASNSDDALYYYIDEPSQENPWYQYAIKGDWSTSTQVSNYYITLLKELKDPRLHAHARLVEDGGYEGHENGAEAEADLSAIGEYYSAPNAPLEFLTYAEAQFIAAEAHFLLGDRASAEAAIKEGLDADFSPLRSRIISRAEELEIEDIEDSIDTYIETQSVLPVDEKEAYNHLMTQKYITNFLQFETYNDWRRTGYPIISAVEEPFVEGMTTPALRFPYPSSELQYNAGNVDAQGVEKGFRGVNSPVWWDSCKDCCEICQ